MMSDYQSMHVSGKRGAYRLMLREHASYGGADYDTVCRLTDAQAATLTASGLVSPWVGVQVAAPSDEEVVQGILVLRAKPGFPGLPEVVLDMLPVPEGTRVPVGDWFLQEARTARTRREPITGRPGLLDRYALA